VKLGLLGNKIGMTQLFDKKGNIIPVTIIKAGPCYITQIKLEKDCGYNAIQLGYIETNEKNLTKPEIWHLKKNNLIGYKHLKEYKIENFIYNIGQEIKLDIFNINQKVNITSFPIGKGMTGNIKIHHFKRGPMAHGSKHHRLQGSLGAGTTPGRVFPGKKMPKRSGNKYKTISNLTIIGLNLNENLLIIKGSIPGKKGNLVNVIPSI